MRIVLSISVTNLWCYKAYAILVSKQQTNVFRALVLGAWLTDEYRVECQNWQLLQASHLFSGTSSYVRNNVFIYAYNCVWFHELKW